MKRRPHSDPRAFRRLLQRKEALLNGHFLLSSGLHSDKYVQCALLLSDPRVAQSLGRSLAAGRPRGAEVVVSPALGGLLIGHEVAKALRLPFLFTERVNGTMSLRRGFELKRGQRVLVVEDVLTTGRSTREVLAVVRRRGARPVGVLSIINRGCTSKRMGVPVRSLLGLPLKAYTPKACPMCKRGLPLEKPGSRN